MDLVAYIRVSKVAGREGDSFQSPTQQRNAIAAITALTPNTRVVAEYEDLDESGGTMNRPGVQQAIHLVETGQADGIVCAYLDRWARTVEALEMIERWAAQGKAFISARERFDATTSQGKFALGMMLLVAKYYRDQITERWDESVRDAIGRGVHVGVPYGYRRANGKGSPLIIEPSGAETVQRIYNLRLRGYSDTSIARELNSHGIPSAKGGRWTRQAVRALVMVKAYMGTAHKGAHELTDAHPAIIPPADWHAAQRDARPPTQNGRYLLSGIARCGTCGYALIGGNDGAGLRYRCATHHAAFKCPAPVSTQADRLEALVADAFLERYGTIQLQPGDARAPEVAATEDALTTARARYEAFRSDHEARDIMGDEDWRADLRKYKQAVTDAERAHADTLRASEARTLSISGDLWDALTGRERREIMRDGLDAVVVRRAKSTRGPLAERVELIWAGELKHDGTGSGIAAAIRDRHP